MAAAITDRTRLIFVCNPNNPTGTCVRRAELDRFLDRVPADVLVVLDEAYREFVTDPDVPDGLETYGDRPNVVVLRTLSKAWGLAGLRIGCLVAAPEVAAAVRKVVTPFSTSAAAQAGGARRAASRRRDARRLRAGRSPSASGSPRRCASWCPRCRTSQANFVWLPLGDRSAAFGAACEQQGVIVRAVPGRRRPGHDRHAGRERRRC